MFTFPVKVILALLLAFVSNTRGAVLRGEEVLPTDLTKGSSRTTASPVEDLNPVVLDVLKTLQKAPEKAPVGKNENSPALNNVFDILATEDQPAAPVLVHKLQEQLFESESESSTESPEQDPNPFLRTKREAGQDNCQMPGNLPERVMELNSFLNQSQFMGLNPQQPIHEPLPSGQPQKDKCPDPNNSWWPYRSEVNLRSSCPWVWEELDLGPSAFPRYLRQAKCLCRNCLTADSFGCEELRQEVKVYRRKGCQGDLALLEEETYTITLGCYCAGAIFQ